MGDICLLSARYLQEYEGTRTIVVAQHYYFQAVSLCPDIGKILDVYSLFKYDLRRQMYFRIIANYALYSVCGTQCIISTVLICFQECHTIN